MDTKEEIVISGISGRYPECNNVEELKEALLKGVDLVTDDERRFPRGIMGIPCRMGKIPELDKFDAAFFGIHAKQAEFMDARHRIICEVVYETIIDAGFNPQELRGSKTGVYAGLGWFTAPETMREGNETDGYSNIGFNSGMAANRISYCFNFHGKSYTLDTGCSSSFSAFINAIDDIRSGHIEAAVVCAGNVLYHPHESSEFNKLTMLAKDGKCKVFSTLRDGFTRSEAVASLLLQKKSVCRRAYATVVGAGSNTNGHNLEGITFPSSEMQLELLKEIYAKQGINPEEVTYVEAHGTGTHVGDTNELEALAKMFCTNRKNHLAVGAVKSNLGHSEVSAGMCGISKVLIAMETGIIPANLHFHPLDVDLPGIKDNNIKVVTENIPWGGGLAALNSFGFGGTNAHLVLKTNPKEKSKAQKVPKYRLVQVSGRTEEAVNHFLDEVEKNCHDEDFLALVDEVHKINCEGHNFRGYTILGDKSKREVERYTKPRPIWLIYTGMGCHWLAMGRDMMRNEIFRNTIKRCAVALKVHGVDLEKILTTTDPKIYNNPTHCFTAITAMEIALTDVLYSLGIVPDGIAGHSLGELGCAYADGCQSPEEAVLIAFARGYASQCVKLRKGAMAAVGLSKEECLKLLPKDIYIACLNGKKNLTVAGPEMSISNFVDQLTAKGIFSKRINTGDVAYHSKYIDDAVPHLYNFIKKVLKTPSQRTTKWVSTSLSDSQKDEPWAQFNCAEYHRNNFSSKVLFDKVYQHIPENAMVIEVAPHGLLQAILKRELNPNVKLLSIANRNSTDNEEFFLSAVGKIFLAGGQPNLKKLYKGVTYPVSRGTKMLAPLVKWDHNVRWQVFQWNHKDSFGQIFRVNISNEKYSYLSGHNIDGRILMPATGFLELAWTTLASLHLKEKEEFPVVAENIMFKGITVLPPKTEVQFLVNINKQSGNFEIFDGVAVVCTGTIHTSKNINASYINADLPKSEEEGNSFTLKSEDIYKECRLRKYYYDGSFQGIKECDIQGLRGRIHWRGNFVSFLDSMMHLNLVSEPSRDMRLPTIIEKVVIDPQEHLRMVKEGQDLPIFFNKKINIVNSGGIEIIGLKSCRVAKRKKVQKDPLLETYHFYPYEIRSDEPVLEKWLSMATQILIQNAHGLIKTLRICTFSENDAKVTEQITNILETLPMVEVDYVRYDMGDEKTKFDGVVITENVNQDINVDVVGQRLRENGVILYQGNIAKLKSDNVSIVYTATSGKDGVHLLRPKKLFKSTGKSVVQISNTEFDWLESIKSLIHSQRKEIVYLVSQYEDISGLIGLQKCLLTELNTVRYRCVLIEDKNAPAFSLDNDFYRDQLQKDLTFNVLRRGKWGTFLHLPLEPIVCRQVRDAAISVTSVGDLSTLGWAETSRDYMRSHSESEKVYVYYSSLNFKDILVASGKLMLEKIDEPTAPDINLGFEYAGITQQGKRVMGMVGWEGLSLQVQTDPDLTWEVPQQWTLDEAASVPVVYATCYYAMIVRGAMRPGESILIHAGAGGVGIAAISIALGMACEVFTTVGSPEKRQFLKNLYPQLKDANIGDSRSSSFRKLLMQNTNGQGVDLVLNSLAGELFQESLKCIGNGGRFLEMGKVDFLNHSFIDSNTLSRNCSFHAITLDCFDFRNSRMKRVLKDLVYEGLRNGVVKPLPRTIFKENEVEDAFRFISAGKHRGKVMIQIRNEISSSNNCLIKTISAIPKVYFDPSKCYILIGGLGGVGLELTEWILRKGATKVILNSRKPVRNGYQSYCLKKWSKWSGITVHVNTDDTTTIDGAKILVACAKAIGPVGGVFNLALVLKDGLIENQSEESYREVFKAKVTSCSNMDAVTRTECQRLDYFVVFSSISCGRGNSGISNYGMANSAVERLCERRKEQGLPALAVQWGYIGNVGAMLTNKLIDKYADQMLAQDVDSCFEALEKFMLQEAAVGASTVVASKRARKNAETTKTAAEAVAHIMGIRNLELVDKSHTLSQLGLDSLMVSEIKQTLYRNYHMQLNTDGIRDLTFSTLISVLAVDQMNAPIEVNKVNEELYEALLCKESIIDLNQLGNRRKTVFMIHPMEGHVEMLRLLAEQLEASVYGIQSTADTDFDSIQDYASHYIAQIKKKQPQDPYLLCGYSFGSAVAVEMGLQLENSGETAQIVLLDGSPAYVKKAWENFLIKHDKFSVDPRAAVLANFVSFLTPIEDKFREELVLLGDWQKQLNRVAEVISKTRNLDVDHLILSADRYYKRCKSGSTYEPKGIFNGKMLLVKGMLNQAFPSEDYDLQQLCKRPVEILKIKGDHNTILRGENVALISEKINAFF